MLAFTLLFFPEQPLDVFINNKLLFSVFNWWLQYKCLTCKL